MAVTTELTADPALGATAVDASRVMEQLGVVMSAAVTGGLAGLDSEQALRVVEAVEVVKAWADSVSVAATAVMVAEIEIDRVDLAPESPSTWAWAWTRFVVAKEADAGAADLDGPPPF